MSRIGKKAVAIPSGVTANVEGQTVKIKGPKGALQVVVHDDVAVKMDKGAIKLDPRVETKRARSQWGTSRTLVEQPDRRRHQGLRGEARDHRRRLSRRGAGQEPQPAARLLPRRHLSPIPQGIAIATPKPTEIVVTGIDKQQVGQVAAEIRGFRPPEPYKGKGVKYAGEYIFRKEGKKK